MALAYIPLSCPVRCTCAQLHGAVLVRQPVRQAGDVSGCRTVVRPKSPATAHVVLTTPAEDRLSQQAPAPPVRRFSASLVRRATTPLSFCISSLPTSFRPLVLCSPSRNSAVRQSGADAVCCGCCATYDTCTSPRRVCDFVFLHVCLMSVQMHALYPPHAVTGAHLCPSDSGTLHWGHGASAGHGRKLGSVRLCPLLGEQVEAAKQASEAMSEAKRPGQVLGRSKAIFRGSQSMVPARVTRVRSGPNGRSRRI